MNKNHTNESSMDLTQSPSQHLTFFKKKLPVLSQVKQDQPKNEKIEQKWQNQPKVYKLARK